MKKENLIFFTGAGISVESGIPTFQEQPGIRDKLTRDFANTHPEIYRQTIREMVNSCEKAEPNAAHKAIAEFDCPVITMNIDQLHTKAGSNHVIEIHGKLPTKEQLEEESFPITYGDLILYGDLAPKYEEAIKLVKNLEYEKSYFIVVGTSFYTSISDILMQLAKNRHAHIVVVNEEASKRVPFLCQNLKRFFLKETILEDQSSFDLE